MESAKKTPQIIELHADVSRRINSGAEIKAFAALPVSPSNQPSAPAVDHRPSEIEQPDDRGKKVNKAQLINKLNYINFQDETVLINFSHLKYDKTICLKASPQPCMGDLVDCLWAEDKNISQIIQSYAFKDLLITNGRKMLKVEAELVRVDKESISSLSRSSMAQCV